jgi:hypothetical protein
MSLPQFPRLARPAHCPPRNSRSAARAASNSAAAGNAT